MILITGATGKAGGELAKRLAAANVPFRALIRNPDKAGPIEALGAEIAIGDIADQAAVERALEGVDKAFLVMPNIEAQLELEKQFTDAAVAAGVKHLVYLSSLESVPESKAPITKYHVEVENYIRESGLAWTMIRPSFFMQMFEGMAARIHDTGRIVMPAGKGAVPTTDLRDVAEVVVKVLTESGHENKSYDMSGPELLTFDEIAQIFSKVLGRQIEYVDQPLEEFRAVLAKVGFPEWRVDAVSKELSLLAGGAARHTADGISELLGRPATSLEQYIRDNEALFR